MSNRYNRPMISRARRRAANRRRLLIGGGALAAIAVIALAIVLLPKGGGPDRAVETVSQPASETVNDAPLVAEGEPLIPLDQSEPDEEAAGIEEADAQSEEDAPLAAEGEPLVAEGVPLTPQADEAAPATAQTQVAASDADPQRVASRPTAEPGFLPVFIQANTEEKIVAITVDDCFQAENLQQIVDKAIEVGGKLTIFPIGQNVLKKRQSEILKYAWENGFELENHTFTHNGLFACSDEELAGEVYKQQLALSYILGVEYQCHFLRPRGGDARNDQRLQMYAKQMGYYGIAHWSVSGSADNSKLAKGLKPGAIYLFHTTTTDLEKLLEFIPWVVEKGYRLVTLNEMFGYPANETGALTTPVSEHVIPALEPYEMVYVPLKKTTYSWEAYLLQQKLIEQGYLSGKPDGVFGQGCVEAIQAYQKDHGMQQTDVADADLVRQIIEGDAT